MPTTDHELSTEPGIILREQETLAAAEVQQGKHSRNSQST